MIAQTLFDFYPALLYKITSSINTLSGIIVYHNSLGVSSDRDRRGHVESMFVAFSGLDNE